MNYSLNLIECQLVNDLWSDFIEQIGFSRAKVAIRQAIDLQNMNGNRDTVPVLFLETCGIGLTTLVTISDVTGLFLTGQNEVLIFSNRKKAYQILFEVK